MTNWKPWVAWALALLVSCGGKTTSNQANGGNGTDSNTHWLSRCSEDADCRDGLSCLCGVCTQTCNADDACEELSNGGLCLALSCIDDGRPEGITLCTRSCTDDDECRNGSRCDGGSCLPDVGYEPCAGRSCGDDCTLCDPDSDAFCQEAEEPKYCHPDGSCQGVGPTCPDSMSDAGTEPPDPFADLPQDCDALAVADDVPECAGFEERCDQMRADGSERNVQCQPTSEVAGGDVDHVADCAGRWLAELGASAIRVEGDVIAAQANWEQLESLLTSSLLQCEAVCVDGSCDYCEDLDEAACGTDAFCYPEQGRPLDDREICYLPPRFAGCLPADRGCDEAESVAVDGDGTCWHFSSICDVRGFDYEVVESGNCNIELPDCAIAPQAGCEAMDVTEAGECPDIIGYAWTGQGCQALTCSCEGEECGDIFESELDCLTAWAGCDANLPTCEDEGIGVDQLQFDVGLFADGPLFLEWTSAEWVDILPLPSDPPTYDLVLIPDGGDAVSWTLRLPAIPNLFNVAAGTIVEFRMDGALAVREENAGPLLMLFGGGTAEGSFSASYTAGAFTVSTSTPFCTLSPAEPGCNLLPLLQRVEFVAPNYISPDGSDPDDTQSFMLVPLSEQEFAVKSDAGDLNYHFRHGASSTTIAQRPGEPVCDVPVSRQSTFSLVRVTAP